MTLNLAQFSQLNVVSINVVMFDGVINIYMLYIYIYII